MSRWRNSADYVFTLRKPYDSARGFSHNIRLTGFMDDRKSTFKVTQVHDMIVVEVVERNTKGMHAWMYLTYNV